MGRTNEDDVKSEDLLLNISLETERETMILRLVGNLVEKCLAKLAGFAGKKDDYKKFYKEAWKPKSTLVVSSVRLSTLCSD